MDADKVVEMMLEAMNEVGPVDLSDRSLSAVFCSGLLAEGFRTLSERLRDRAALSISHRGFEAPRVLCYGDVVFAEVSRDFAEKQWMYQEVHGLDFSGSCLIENAAQLGDFTQFAVFIARV